MAERVPRCKCCDYFPTHTAQGYYLTQQKCLYRVMGYDCRRFVPTKERKRRLEL